MKAVINHQYGGPELLQIKNLDKPVPKDNELLIKTYAITVNRTDCGILRGRPWLVRLFFGLFEPKNKILGNEYAGRVEEVGKSVTSFKRGDKVFGYNDVHFGAHAEFMIQAEHDCMATIPKNLSYEEAAPILEGAHYALCNIRAAKIQPGQKVLVNGATGAIGSAAVQLLKYYEAEVTAVCHGKHRKIVKDLGADVIIDYTQQEFTQLAGEFDFVFDAVGKSPFEKCRRILKPRGIYISTELGYLFQNPFLAIFSPLFRGRRLLFPIPTINKEDVLFFKKLVETKKFKPLIDKKRFTFEKIAEAYRYAETGQKIGNLVISLE